MSYRSNVDLANDTVGNENLTINSVDQKVVQTLCKTSDVYVVCT